MWLLVAPRAAKVLMVMRASVSSRLILASAPRNGAVRGPQPEATVRKSGCRLTRNLNCPPSPAGRDGQRARASRATCGEAPRHASSTPCGLLFGLRDARSGSRAGGGAAHAVRAAAACHRDLPQDLWSLILRAVAGGLVRPVRPASHSQGGLMTLRRRGQGCFA